MTGIAMTPPPVRVCLPVATPIPHLPPTHACRMTHGCGRHCKPSAVALGAVVSMMLTASPSYLKRGSAPLLCKASAPIRLYRHITLESFYYALASILFCDRHRS